MDKIIQVSNPVVGVAAGQTATCDLPIGQNYHSIIIEATATGKAATTLTLADVLGLITVNINGKPFRQMLATELDAIQTKYGADFASLAFNATGAGNTLAAVYSSGAVQAPQAASITTFLLRINFSEPWRKSYAARESRSLTTAWVDGSVLKSLQLQIACPNTGNFAASPAYSIRVHTITDTRLGQLDANKNPVTNACKWYRTQVPYTATGDLPIVNLVKTSPGRLAILEEQTFFMPSTDIAQRAVVTADGRQVRDCIKVINDVALLDNGYNASLNTGNAYRFDLDYDYSDLPSDGLVLSSSTSQVNTHKVTLNLTTVGAANALTCISQVYGPID